MRRHNAQLVLTALARGTASRAVLAQRTGLTKSTVSSLVDSLITQQVLIEGNAESDGPGRPSRPVSLNPDGLLALGVEINVDYVAAGLVDLTGRVRQYIRSYGDNRMLPVEQTIANTLALTTELTHDAPHTLLGVGLAVPGVVGPDGEVIRAPNLPRLVGYKLSACLGAGFAGLPVHIENEANCGALARLRFVPHDSQNFVYVTGEVGVGAGVVLSGMLFRGVNGFAGELGHVVVERNGPSCACGGRGCVEQYAGLQAVLKSAGQPTLTALRSALDGQDRRAVAAVADAGSALGVGLSSMLNVLDLPLVVMGGLYADLFAEITPSLTAELEQRVLSSRRAGGRVHRGTLGEDAAVCGAAGLVIDQALSDPEALLSSA